MILQINKIGMSFAGESLLNNISLKVEANEKVGLIGINGAGKSTILKIITGELLPDCGDIFLAKDKRMGYLKQNECVNLDNSIMDEMLEVFSDLLQVGADITNLELKMSDPEIYSHEEKLQKIMKQYSLKSDYFSNNGGYEINSKIAYVLNGMGFKDHDWNMKVNALSGGQKTKLALSKLLLSEPDLLLLDEPTNHLDFNALLWLENYIKNYKGAVLIVSHDRYFLDTLVESIYEIERGGCKRYTGNYSKFLEQKEQNKMLQEKYYVQQQAEITRLQTFIDKNIAGATSSKAAKNKRHALNRIDVIDKPLKHFKKVHMNFQINETSHKDVLTLSNGVLNVGEQENRINLSNNINCQVYRGDKVALIGPNGIGKSTLLKTLVGDNPLDFGKMIWGRRVLLGYCDQEHNKLDERNTILQELREEFPLETHTEIRRVLGNFRFTKDDVNKNISELSGGEKSRVALAKLMLKKVNVLILDEPTNHLDLSSKEILEKALRKYEGTVIFVSHDRYFINKVANKTMILSEDGIEKYNGNYDYYLSKVSV